MTPSIGRIVHYRLTDDDVATVSSKRSEGKLANSATAGDVYPAIIVRIWTDTPTEDTAVQHQVFIDGEFTIWATSRQQGDENGKWSAVPRI